jgi:S1-C subfamily serine protease
LEEAAPSPLPRSRSPVAPTGPPASFAQSAPQPRSLPDFTDLVEQVGPAVVNIRTMEKVRAAGGGQQGQMDEEMQEFFRRFFGVPMPNQPNAAAPAREVGRRPPVAGRRPTATRSSRAASAPASSSPPTASS